MNQNSGHETYIQKAGKLSITFILDKQRNTALFENVDFALDSNITPTQRLKLFCTLLRNSTADLISKDIKKIYHFVTKEDFETFKNSTVWKIEHHNLSFNKQLNERYNLLLLSCDILDFIDNIAKGLSITI